VKVKNRCKLDKRRPLYHIDVRGRIRMGRAALKWWSTWEGPRQEGPISYAADLATRLCQARSGRCCSDFTPHRFGEPIHSAGVRVRYKGRVIARWVDGKRLKLASPDKARE
jgi:hypothetical protein